MLMQDKNNAEIAEVIQRWLAGKGLVDDPTIRKAGRSGRRGTYRRGT
jgi:hypothetical protein